jgi:hypothetical protein
MDCRRIVALHLLAVLVGVSWGAPDLLACPAGCWHISFDSPLFSPSTWECPGYPDSICMSYKCEPDQWWMDLCQEEGTPPPPLPCWV